MKHIHHWQQIEVNKPKLYDSSRESIVDFITTPFIVTRKLLCTRCAELKTIVEPDPMEILLKRSATIKPNGKTTNKENNPKRPV